MVTNPVPDWSIASVTIIERSAMLTINADQDHERLEGADRGRPGRPPEHGSEAAENGEIVDGPVARVRVERGESNIDAETVIKRQEQNGCRVIRQQDAG